MGLKSLTDCLFLSDWLLFDLVRLIVLGLIGWVGLVVLLDGLRLWVRFLCLAVVVRLSVVAQVRTVFDRLGRAR